MPSVSGDGSWLCASVTRPACILNAQAWPVVHGRWEPPGIIAAPGRSQGLVPTTDFICISVEFVGVLAPLQSITCGSGSSVSVGNGASQVLLLRHSRPASARKGWLQSSGSVGCRASGKFLVYFSEEKPWFHDWHED